MKHFSLRYILIALLAIVLLAGCCTAAQAAGYDVTLSNKSGTPTPYCGEDIELDFQMVSGYRSGTLTNHFIRYELYKDGELYTELTSRRYDLSYSAKTTDSVRFETDPNDPDAVYTVKAWVYWPDSDGNRVVNSNTVVVDNITVKEHDCAISDISAVWSTGEVGSYISWKVSVSTSISTDDSVFHGSYTVKNLTTGRVYTNDCRENGPVMTVNFKPTEPGVYNLCVNAKVYLNVLRNYYPYGTGMYFDSGLITVTDPGKPQIDSVTSSHAAIGAGQENTWTITASGGSGELSYRYDLYRGGSLVTEGEWTDSTSFTATFPELGEYTVKVSVKDKYGHTGDPVTSAVLKVSQEMAIDQITAPAAGYTMKPLTCTAVVNGSTDGAQYFWRVYEGDTLLTSSEWQDSDSFSYTPQKTGSLVFSVSARNNLGENTAEFFSEPITVAAPLVLNSITGTGECAPCVSRRWNANSTGGFGAVSYHFQLFRGDTLIKDYGWDTRSYIFTNGYTDAGNYTITVTARDENGHETPAQSETFYVTDSKPILEEVQVLGSLKKGKQLSCCARMYFMGDGECTYKFKLLKDGEVLHESDWLTNEDPSSYYYMYYEPEYYYPSGGDYELIAMAQDGDGDVSLESTTFHVDSIPVITGVTFDNNQDFRASQPFTITAHVMDGEGKITYTFQRFYRPAGLYTDLIAYDPSEPSEDPSFTYFIENSCQVHLDTGHRDYHNIVVTATDEDGDSATFTASGLLIYPAPRVSWIQAPTGEAKTLDTAEWKILLTDVEEAPATAVCVLKCDGEVVATQEFGPLRPEDSELGLGQHYVFFSHTFSKGGTYVLEVYAEDEFYVSPTKVSDPFTVTEVRPVVTDITPGERETYPGAGVDWVVNAEGYGTNYTYFYRVLRNGEVYQNIGWKDSSVCSFRFSEPGMYQLEVRVSNAEGYTSDFVSSEKITILCSEHVPQVLPAVEPGCLTTGLTEGADCAVCHQVTVAQEVIEALGHEEVTLEAVAPTCTETGLTEGRACSRCETTLKAQKTIAATGHTRTVDPAVSPTCTTPGKTEGVSCHDCGYIFKEQKEIPIRHELNFDDHIAKYVHSPDNTSVTGYAYCELEQQYVPVETVTLNRIRVEREPTATTSGQITYYYDSFIRKEFNTHYATWEIIIVPALNSLTKMVLPESLTVIEDEAFMGTLFGHVTIPETCTSIGSRAFKDCPNLKYIKVPEETEIAPDAFEGCENVYVVRY